MMRYKYLRSFLMVLGVVLLMPQGMHAQNIDDFKKDTTSFNALDHLITPRYRTPDKHVFVPGWLKHISMGVYTDQSMPFIAPHRNDFISKYNFHWGAFVNKYFDQHNGIRLNYDYANMALADDKYALRHQLGLDYMWDMSNYYFGYNEARPWSLAYVVGMDFGRSSIADAGYYYGGLHTGLQVRANLSPRSYFFVEPRVSAYTNNHTRDDWHNIDVKSHVLVGWGARLTSPYKPLQWTVDEDTVTKTDNYFIQLSMGAFDSFADMRAGAPEMGPSFHFAVGRWFNPKLGVRTSLYAEQLNRIHRNRRAGAMVEGVMSIPHFFGFDMGRFGLEVSGGMRYDRVCWALGQWGSSSAIQLKYFVNKQFALFADARYSSMYNGEHDRYDEYGNFNLGVEFYKSNYNRYSAKYMTMGDVEYRRGFFASVAYGRQYPFLMGGDWLASLNPSYNFTLGYRFDDYSALRLKFDNTEYEVEGIKSKTNWSTFSPQYMFNVTNWWLGNTNHRFDLRPYAGPVISLTDAEYFGHGIEIGMPVVWKVAPAIELFVEPSYRYMSGWSLKQCLLYDKGMWNMTAGISYVNGPLYFRRYMEEFNWGKDWFVSVYGGLQKDHNSNGYDDVMMEPGDITALPIGNVAVGRWFGPVGARVSAFGSLNRTYQEPFLLAMAYAGGRLEGMLNVSSLFAPTKELRKFEFDILGGYHGSVLYRPLPQYEDHWAYASGPTVAAQLKYYVRDGIGLFIEPRHTWLGYERQFVDEYGGTIPHFEQRITDVSVGMEIRQRNPIKEELKKSYAGFTPRTFVSADFGLSYPMNFFHVKPVKDVLGIFSPHVGLAVGREFNALSSIRFRATYNNLQSDFTDAIEHGMSGSVEYMLNVTNAMLGYDPSRIMDVKATVGVDALYSTYKNRTNLGWHLGAQWGFRASDNWKIFAEGNVAVYHKPEIVEGMRIVRDNGLMPQASIGAAYYF